MRTTIDLPEGLVKDALRITKARTKTMVVILGLQELINRHRIESLRAMRGKFPNFNVDLKKSRERT